MANDGVGVSIKIDGEKEFNKVLNDYMQWSRKAPSEIVNSKMYFIAQNAINVTKKADPNRLAKDLNSPSNTNPEKTLGEMIVLKRLSNNGKMYKKTSTLIKNMPKLVQKLINSERTHCGFLASGWLPAIKKLYDFRRVGEISFLKRNAKDGGKIDRSVKQYGKPKGDVYYARPNPRCFGILSNLVGVQASKVPKSPTAHRDSAIADNILKGAQLALRMEIASMNIYLQRKYKEKLDKLNKTETFK